MNKSYIRKTSKVGPVEAVGSEAGAGEEEDGGGSCGGPDRCDQSVLLRVEVQEMGLCLSAGGRRGLGWEEISRWRLRRPLHDAR